MSAAFLLPVALLPAFAGICLLRIPFRKERVLHVAVEGIALLTTALVWALLLTGSREPFFLYTFSPGFSLVLHLDGMSCLYAGLVSVMWPVVLLYAFAYMEQDPRQRSFFAFFLMTYGATLGVSFSGSMLTLFFFFEMLSLSTIPLVAHEQDHESLYAARKYAAYVIGGSTLAFVTVILATLSGGTDLFTYGGNLGGVYPDSWMRVAYLCGFFGFGTKAAIFPLHRWLPTASCAPTPVTGLLHAVAVVNTGVFSIIRLTYYTFGQDLLFGTWTQTVALLAASFTLLTSSAIAVQERHLKRRLAYSTVSNLSYMLFGLLLLTPEGFTAATAHMVFHSVTKITLFLCIGSFMHTTGKEYLTDVNGAGRRMPWTFAFYTISALSLVGMPLLCGFVSKWRLLTAAAAEGGRAAYIGVGALILSAALCAIYELSICVRAFLPYKESDRFIGVGHGPEGGWRMLFPIAFFTFFVIYFGMFPGTLLAFLEKIGEGLL